jgi:hypothetical protein
MSFYPVLKPPRLKSIALDICGWEMAVRAFRAETRGNDFFNVINIAAKGGVI